MGIEDTLKNIKPDTLLLIGGLGIAAFMAYNFIKEKTAPPKKDAFDNLADSLRGIFK